LSLRELAATPKSKGKSTRIRKLSSKESKRIRLQGHRAERDLVKKLRAKGFKAVRVPASAPSSEPLPDVFATKGNCVFAFEVKATSMDRIYFKKEQVKKLFDFLGIFQVYEKKAVVLAGKFPHKWIFKHVDSIGDYVVQNDDKSTILTD
jgi:Holliday junction resolvase